MDQELANGYVRMTVDEAEWWGASLGVLVAAIHHPRVLASRQPDTDPAEVAREVLAGLDELSGAIPSAQAERQRDDDSAMAASAAVRRDGDDIVFSPGAEIANLALCLEVFASAVLDPDSADAATARGATAYAAAAWSADIGKATGAL